MRRLLVIGADGLAPDSGVHSALDRHGTFRCDRIAWDEHVPETLRTSDVEIVIAFVTRECERMSILLDQMYPNLGRKPILAILPAGADEPLFRTVLRTVDDYIVQPARAIELSHRIDRLIGAPQHDEAAVSSRLLEEMALAKLVGRDPTFIRAVQQVPRFARFDMSVMITGETGTGKEVCARALHHLSKRRNHPFIAVDCGAIPDPLFENELFGHARGAFTDAHRDHKGLIAMAEGGTLFFDEIDALSLAEQAKLLRFLQEHSFHALGSDRIDRSNVKVLAATNRDIEACVKNNQVRTDLYFRLNVLRIHLPPLRERPGDIPLLAYSALKDCRASVESAPTSFTPAAMRTLTTYQWPGNVRELYNVVQRAVVVCDGNTILPAHISLAEAATQESSTTRDFRTARAAAVAAFERHYFEEILRKHRGNVTHAAREARQDRRAFGRFIKKYQINRSAP